MLDENFKNQNDLQEKSAFFAALDRLKLIQRWSLMRNFNKENVAEHSFQVALISQALFFLREALIQGELKAFNIEASKPEISLDLGSVLSFALLHDASEIITGDLPTPVKYFNQDLKKAYKEVEVLAEKSIYSLLPESLKSYYSHPFSACEKTEKEYLIESLVKAADELSAYFKCLEELRFGNKEFQAAKATIYQKLQNQKFKEVKIFLAYFEDAYKLSLDELSQEWQGNFQS